MQQLALIVVDGIKKAYETGKGKIIIRGKTEVESIRGGKQQIVITEIPFEVNKANLVKKMDELRLDKKVEGIDAEKIIHERICQNEQTGK